MADQPGAYGDLDRPPLRGADLQRALLRFPGVWSRLEVVAETGSTNVDVAQRAAAGELSGLVLVAEAQTAGRGRLDRTWAAPPRSGLTFSVLLRPAGVPPARWGWFPLLAGVAVAAAVTLLGEVDARVKWPNDVLVGERKLAGLLSERVGEALVLGVGLNVSARADEVPATATSLLLEGSPLVDRGPLLLAILRELGTAYDGFVRAAGDPLASGLRDTYRRSCATLGQEVRVQLPDERTVVGRAHDVDADGRLVVRSADGGHVVGAGDVVHLHHPR
ncbi:MAG TPA: biotin--[acetyl-CoA-carboxylase] ligase [Actinomycetes bacterium]